MNPKYLKIAFFVILFIASRYFKGPPEHYIFPLVLLYFVFLNVYELFRMKIKVSKILIYSLLLANAGLVVFSGFQIWQHLFSFNLCLGLLISAVFLQMVLLYFSLKKPTD